ncbi:MAG TPA: FMN-binding protein [Candidatus Binatia bacterium]|nr:FMN-binding protein [Candidatus Binatia bacterium]
MRRAAAALLLLTASAVAGDRAPSAFVADCFEGPVPSQSRLAIAGALRDEATRVLGHPPPAALPYWRRGVRTAWVLEEIGKERPITAGFAIEHGRLIRVEVLAYRESRGWEVRLPAFTRQFTGAGLASDRELDRRIDNISGATLSVGALRRMARAALLFDHAVTA